MFFDRLVHPRLRQRGFVAFVMAMTAVAKHVDDDVLAELLSEFVREPDRADARFGVIAVDVKDRRLHGLRGVGGIHR